MRCNGVVRIACWLAMGAMILGGGADATPPKTNDSAACANGKANTGTERVVTGDATQINTVVAGTPPSATISLVPVPAKVGSYPPGAAIVGNELRLEAGGVRTWFEVRLSGWDPNHDNIPPLIGFQATVDATGYLDSDAPGDQPDLAPAVVACGTAGTCTAGTCVGGSCAGQTCLVNADCDAACICRKLFGESWAKCGNNVCIAGTVDTEGTGRPDSWCAPSGGGCIVGVVDTSYPDYRWVSVSDSTDGHPDQPSTCVGGTRPGQGCTTGAQCPGGGTCTGPGLAFYHGGSLVLDVPFGAEGRYTVNLSTDDTFLWDSTCLPDEIPMLSETGFVVNVTLPPPNDIIWDPSETSPLRGSRSMTIGVAPAATATGPGVRKAIKVTQVELQNVVPLYQGQSPPPDFSRYELWTCSPATGESVPATSGPNPPSGQGGCARWVGKPAIYLESQDQAIGARFKAARLQCTPYYTDWVAETQDFTTIAVVGAEIAPSSQYDVQEYPADSCEGTEAEADCINAVTAAETIYTRRMGDVTGPYDPPSSEHQPNVEDVTVIVYKFKSVPGSPSKGQLQLQPNLAELNGDVNVLDIVAVVDAIKGRGYSFGGPCPCPSLAACGALACTSAMSCTGSALPGLGSEALCVKTCTGGVYANDPCIYNRHCRFCVGGTRNGLGCETDADAFHGCPGGMCPTTVDCGVPKACVGGTNDGNVCVTTVPDCPGADATCASNVGYCRDRCGRCKP